MINATVNRIGFEIHAGYEIRDHIMWSKNIDQIGKLYKFETVWTSVSGTSDVPGITPHSYTITSRRDGRFALRAYKRGKVCQYGVWGLRGEQVFDTSGEAQWFAAWHSEGIFFAEIA